MSGDERSRLCEQCDTRVVNLSSMTPVEVDALAASTGEKFCVRYIAKPDGTPRLRTAPARRSFLKRSLAAAAFFVPALAGGCRDDTERDDREEDEMEETVGNGRVFMGLE